MKVLTRTVEANGFRFAVDEAGEGEHLALCLHGFPESRLSWRHQLPFLASIGYRAWAPDLRGYGDTEPRPQDVASYRVEALVEDVAALAEASGARRLTLIGHDWGAFLAWAFASWRRRPLEQLVIMNVPHPAGMRRALRRSPAQLLRSWYMAFFQLPALPELLLGRGGGRAIRRAFVAGSRDPSRFPPEILDHYAANAARPGALKAMINWYRAAAREGMLGRTWPRIDTPALIVWGEADIALGLETLEGVEAYVPNLTLRRLPGVSHWVQQEAPEAVNAILAEWLAPASAPAAPFAAGYSQLE